MRRHYWWFLLCLTWLGSPAISKPTSLPVPVAPNPLKAYVQRPDASFHWTKTNATETPALRELELDLTSQTWQGKPWSHRLLVVRPREMKYPDWGIIMISGVKFDPREKLLAELSGQHIGITSAMLWSVPNQPLFDRTEDSLVAYTLGRYFQTGDQDWPLLLPMTKSVVSAMNATTQAVQAEFGDTPKKWVVLGASKRGWTTWLTAAVDDRVKAIVPLVYDNLNIPRQLAHQQQCYGTFSDRLKPFTDLGLQTLLPTARGQSLLREIDPWYWRDQVTIPKLLINATNDLYWTLDSFNLYRQDLKGQTNVLYVPNVGHMMQGAEELILGTAGQWVQRVVRQAALPRLSLSVRLTGSAWQAQAEVNQPPVEVRLWTASAPSRDFRTVHWTSRSMAAAGAATAHLYTATINPPGDAQFFAAFSETDFGGEFLPFKLSSPVVVQSVRSRVSQVPGPKSQVPRFTNHRSPVTPAKRTASLKSP